MSREEQNPYSVLGLKSRASHNEVKQAYRSLCRKFHPDKAAHLDEATRREREAQMVRLNVAYQVLNSPQQRFDYDLAQPRPETPGEATGESAFDRPSTPSYARANPSGGKFRYQYSAKYTQRSRQARRMDPSQYTTHVDGRAAEFTGRPRPPAEGRSPTSDPDLQRPMPWEQKEMDLIKEWMEAFCPPEPPEEQYQWTRASNNLLRNLKEKRQQRCQGESGKSDSTWTVPVTRVQP
mmetsp:Transcript_1912/g.4526  ORF Transcript_1912/g.4526 Transcript_1912/m.4526 type:complete len:236 (-) Transcript_1912:59-766(-)